MYRTHFHHALRDQINKSSNYKLTLKQNATHEGKTRSI